MMAYYFSLLLLALAVSLDSFNVGFTYGLRKMTIPIKSIIILAFCSAVTLLIAMFLGNALSSLLSPGFAEKIGAAVFILIGIWVLYQFFRPAKTTHEKNEQKVLINFEIKSIGLVIKILRKPTVADFDNSGTITGIEAFMLGLALSLDAFGAGIGAALLNYSPLLMAFTTALMSSIFVLSGLKLGNLFSKIKWIEKFSFLPGILLIMLGLWKM